MKAEEHETNINWDYFERVIRVYTTREGVKTQILRRLGAEHAPEVKGNGPWTMTIPFSVCRAPQLIAKLLNPDERTPMTDEQKAALRGGK